MPFSNQDPGLGQDNPPEGAYDKAHGTYKSNVPRDGNAGATLPNTPQGTDPSPFTLGNTAPGGR